MITVDAGPRYMIVHQFREWARTASPSSRADGASALARAYLYSDLETSQRAEALAVLTAFLDDPSPLVRRALAEAFASAVDAPSHILLALADDQPSIAAIVLGRSPMLSDAELIDCAAVTGPEAQAAIATRPGLSPIVAVTLAEIAAPEALTALARNETVLLSPRAIARMIERHGDVAELREALLLRGDLPASVRIELVSATARALGAFVTGRSWISDERMKRIAHEAKDKAAVTIGADENSCARDLVAHLRCTGQLSVGFALRTLLSGRVELFKAVLAELADVPMSRVDGLVAAYDTTGFGSLYRKASLPLDLLPVFRIALQAIAETDWAFIQSPGLSRQIIERVLTDCIAVNQGELDKLLVLLRRFESEAARDEARSVPRVDGRPPLALTDRARMSEPLLLTDIDAADYQLPSTHGLERLRVPVEIDLAAIEAELLAA